MTPTVLCVCTGNICRSPAMELYLARAWGTVARVRSAGTHGQENIDWGLGVPDDSAAAMRARGLDPAGHRPTQLTAEALTAADLVLVATDRHARWARGQLGGAGEHVFLLHEAAELAGWAERPAADSLAGRIAGAAEALAAARRERPAERRDIRDPWSMGPRVNREVVDEIAAACDTLIDWLA